MTLKENIMYVAMGVIESLASVDPNRFRPSCDTNNGVVYLNGDWRVTDKDK